MMNQDHVEDSNARAYKRYAVNAPIRFRAEGEKDVFSALTKNYSKGGLGFISSHPLPENSVIHFAPPIAGQTGSAPIYAPEAKLIWQKKRSEPPYIAGIKWLSVSCNWCNKTVPFRQLYQTKESISLCNECLEELDSHLKGHLKTCMHQYLQGNVL